MCVCVCVCLCVCVCVCVCLSVRVCVFECVYSCLINKLRILVLHKAMSFHRYCSFCIQIIVGVLVQGNIDY